MCFFRKITKICYICGENARNKCFRSNIGSFRQIFVKYLPFPHPDISLMTKNLAQIKVYPYFNKGDAKTLVKYKEK